jgi:hypothetical protein
MIRLTRSHNYFFLPPDRRRRPGPPAGTLLIVSGLFGALAKAAGMYVEVWRQMHRSFLNALPAIFELHAKAEQQINEAATFLGMPSPNVELTPEHLVRVAQDVAPVFYRRRIAKAANRPGDPLAVLKGAVRASHIQSGALVGQVAFWLAGAVALASP